MTINLSLMKQTFHISEERQTLQEQNSDLVTVLLLLGDPVPLLTTADLRD